MPFVSSLADGRVILALYVQPRASRNCLVGLHDQALKLALTAPPVENEANKAIVVFFSSFFKIARQDVAIFRGLQSRRKQVALRGLSEEMVRARICDELESRGIRESN